MSTPLEVFTKLGQSRTEQLLAQYEGGFTTHPLSHLNQALSKAQARQWLYTLAWWDIATVRSIGSLPKGYADAFEKGLVIGIYGYLWQQTDDSGTDPEERFSATCDAMFDAWNKGVDSGESTKAIPLALLVGLKSMGITLAETAEYETIFSKTFEMVHQRRISLATLLQEAASSCIAQKAAWLSREAMSPADVRAWLARRPPDDEFLKQREEGTVPSDEWRSWSAKAPTKDESAAAGVLDDPNLSKAVMDAMRKKAWIDTAEEIMEHGWPDDIYHATPEEQEIEARYQELDVTDRAVAERAVPGFTATMGEIDKIEDDDLRAMARKRAWDPVADKIEARVAADIEREKWRESPAGRIASFLVSIGIVFVLVLLARGC